jgi:hypothetical protein
MQAINFLILLMLTMPALSLTGILGFPYFPNEKLVFLMIFFLFMFGKYKLNVSDTIFFSFLSIVFIVIFINQGLSNLTIANFNLIYFCLAIIFYIAYFKKFGQEILVILPIIVGIQLTVSFSEQALMHLGFHEASMMFNNYPPQETYIYPISYAGLFRTSGLFYESSQYAVFLLVYIVLYIEGEVKNNKFSRFIFSLSFVDFFITESITAFIIIFIYGLYKLFFSRGKILNKLGLFFSSLFLISFFIDILLNMTNKVVGTIFMTSSSYSRLSEAIYKIIYVSENAFFTGYGLSWDPVSHDFFSVYYYAFGIFGLAAFILFLIYLSMKSKNFIFIIFFISLFVNASLLISINIILISLSTFLGYKNNIMRTNK